MLTIHQLLGNKQPQTPDTTLRQRQRHEHTALSPETPDLNSLNSFTMPPERKRTFYSMRQIDMLSKEDLITTRFPRFWRMQSCLTQIPLGLWVGCTIVLMSALILMEGCFYWQQEQGQDLSPLNQGRSLLVALQQDQILSLPQPQMQALSPSQALTLSPAALDPETAITVATTAQLTNTSQGNVHHTAFATSSAAAAPAKAVALDQDRSLRAAIFRTVGSTEGHNTGLRATASQHSLGASAVAHQAAVLDLTS